MWRLILLGFCYHVLSLPVTDEPSTRYTRELIECCPCPGSNQKVSGHGGQDILGSASDDCPCRFQSADSEGASTMFVPTQTAAGRTSDSGTFMRSNDPKDDIKNLLQPEVGLAASMLETLSEATEEEYRDALAREAARAADAIPEESARNVVIIVKPRADEDDFVSEESNVKESRRIHPLDSSFDSMRTVTKPLKTLPDFFRIPNHKQPLTHKNLWDMDSYVGASDVQTSVVDMDEGASELEPRTNLFELGTSLKQNQQKSSINNDGLKLPSVFNKLEESWMNRPNLFKRFNLPLMTKIKDDNPLRKANNDSSPAPSNDQDFIEDGEENGVFIFNKRPLMLKNLLNLKDIELIKKTVPKRPIFKSSLHKKESLNIDAADKCADFTYDSAINEKVLMPENVPAKNGDFDASSIRSKVTNQQNVANSIIDSENDAQDAITSPSEMEQTVLDITEMNTEESEEVDCNNLSSEEIVISTTESISKVLENYEASETLDPTQESEIVDITENQRNSNIDPFCETVEVLEHGNEDSDTGSSNDITHVIPLNEENIFLPECPEPDQETITPLANANEDLTIIQNVDDKTQIIELELPESDHETITPSDNDNEDLTNVQNADDKTQIIEIELPEPDQETITPLANANEDLTIVQNADDKTQMIELELPEPDQETITPLANANEDLTIVQNADDKTQIIELELPQSDQDTITPSANDNEDLTNIQNTTDKTQIIELESRPSEINKNIIPKSNPIPPLSEALSTIRDNVKKSIENLKRTAKIINPEKFQEGRTTETPITDNLIQEPIINGVVKETDNSKSEVKEIPDQVTFKDLQKLSDDLLVLSSNNEQSTTPKYAAAADVLNGPFETEFEPSEDELTTISDAGIPKADNIKTTVKKKCRIGFADSKTKQNAVQQSKSVSLNENSKDLSVEGSAPTANILPAFLDPLNLNEKLGSPLFTDLDPLNLNEKLKSPILSNIDPLNLDKNVGSSLLPNLDPINVRSSLQDIIVQPAVSERPFNLIKKPIIEVLKLPTLEDIRNRLSSVFDDRSAENSFPDEFGEFTNDAPEMIFAASTNNLRKVPALRPLEDFNVDLFQLNPLSSSKPDFFSKAPRLNLNNFQAKLPIPNDVDLKPVKLESRVGNNKGNNLRALLTFGNEKENSRKAKPNHSNLLGQPLGNWPSLDELRNTLHSGTRNLLGTPLQPNLDLFRNSNLGFSSFPDVDEIRRNAEMTMKGLQQRMKSAFKGGQLLNPLGEKFARPQDFLEDVNDKLKAIHYDLNDRLSSIHEDFLDQSRFKPLASPSHIPFSSNLNSNRNVMKTIRKPKVKPARLQTAASTISTQEIDQFENTDNDRSFMLAQAKSNSKRVQSNPHRTLTGAGSSPVPTKLEITKPKSSIDIPKKSTLPALSRLPSLRQGAETRFPQNMQEKPLVIPRQPSFVKDLKRPILGKSSILGKPSPFKDNNSKVTITFATTTPNPVAIPVGKLKTPPLIKPYTQNIHIKPNGESLKEKFALSRPQTLDDVKQSASEFVPLRMSTPVKSKNNFKNAISDNKDIPQLQNLKPNEESKSRFFNLKGNKDSKLRVNENNWDKPNAAKSFVNNKPEMKKIEVPKLLVWPKSGEDSFLAKVREAMQARLNSFNPGKVAKNAEVAKVENIENNIDMTRSASEISDVIVEEPLKENVSYKCKMVCTKAK